MSIRQKSAVDTRAKLGTHKLEASSGY